MIKIVKSCHYNYKCWCMWDFLRDFFFCVKMARMCMRCESERIVIWFIFVNHIYDWFRWLFMEKICRNSLPPRHMSEESFRDVNETKAHIPHGFHHDFYKDREIYFVQSSINILTHSLSRIIMIIIIIK